MRLIAHRGNTAGPSQFENAPDYLVQAMNWGFDVEVDVWWQDGWTLGHDAPVYPVETEFLRNPRIWAHCKHYPALQRALAEGIHCFYHTDEDYALTSQGWIWAYPGLPGDERTICVMPERESTNTRGFAGVCSDWPSRYA